MDPDRRAVPGRGGQGAVQAAVASCGSIVPSAPRSTDLAADPVIERAERAAAERRRCTGGVDLVQLGDEPAKPRSSAGQVDIGVAGDVLADDPLADQPREGKPCPGAPRASGIGTASGRSGASRGSHRCCTAASAAAARRRGRRTARSPPSRKTALSVPAERTSVNGRCPQCGNCAAISRAASGRPAAISPGFIPAIGHRPPFRSGSSPRHHGTKWAAQPRTRDRGGSWLPWRANPP